MKKIDLTKGNVLKVIMALALPVMGTSFLQFSYNFIDMLWVGGLGTDAIASVGTSSFIIALGYAINAIVIVGTGVKVSHAMGKSDERDMKAYVNNGLVLNAIIAAVYVFVLIVFGKQLIGFFRLGVPSVEADAYKYLVLNGLALGIAFFNILYTRIVGAIGNNKEAFRITTVGIVVNIVLDPILIYGLGLGVAGAGLATLIGNLVMFILFNIRGKNVLRYDSSVGIDYPRIKTILKLGFPMMCQRVLFTLVNIVLARFVTAYGVSAIAAQKVGLQIESIMYMVVGGLNSAMASYAGQNLGSKKYDRINKGYHAALGVGITYALISTIVLLTIPEVFVKLFVRDQETIYIASNYLRIVGAMQIFGAIEMISNGLYTGIGLPKIPATISIIFTTMRIPMAMLFTTMYGVNGVWLSIGLSSLIKGSVSYATYRIRVWRRYESIANTSK